MKRRQFLTLAGAGGCLLRGALPTRAARGAAGHSGSRARPNVVLIISDDQHWGDYGFMGHPTIRTPHLDRLASRSLVLTRSYVPTSLCRPSLATLSTGRYPHEHGIVGNDPRGGMKNVAGRAAMIRLFRKSPSLAGLLGKAGYVSLQTGKWWEGSPVANGGFTAGMTQGKGPTQGRHGDAGLAIGRKGLKPVFDFIERAGAKPFFIWYAPFMPHTPHTPPARLLKRYARPGVSKFIARYQAMCEWFDETCGQLLDYLDRKGLAGNTLVAYVCDNGWIQKPNARGGDYARSKRSPYDGGVRTPIMLRWPGKIAPRTDKRTLAGSVDLAPTILRACGVTPPAEMAGVNLLDAAALAGRKAIFGEVFAHDIVDLKNPASGLQYRWCIEGRWKLILPHRPNVPGKRPELYDVVADPHEKTDLSARHAEKVEHLTKLIDAWWPIPAS